MLTSIPNYCLTKISKHLEPKDIFNLSLTNKYLLSLYSKELFKHYEFKYNQTVEFDEEHLNLVRKLVNFNEEPINLHKFKNLKVLDFNESYEHQVSLQNLPPKIKILKFGFCFKKYFKPLIINLLSNKDFLQKLEELHIGHPAGYIYEDIAYHSLLPKNLKRLNWKYNEPLNLFQLPQTLITVHTHNIILEPFSDNRLTNLKTLIVENYQDIPAIPPNSLPKNLKVLTIWKYNHPLEANTLPENLRKLEFFSNFNQPINNLANFCPNIEELYLGDFDQEVNDPNMFPKTLKKLTFGANFQERKILPGVLPEGLEELYLKGCPYAEEFLPGCFPSTLKKLVFEYGFTKPFTKGVLPDGLEILDMGSKIKHQLTEDIKPSSLKELL